MKKVFIDRSGERYGKLTVLKRWDKNKHGHVRWLCVCDCGVFKVVVGNSLKSGLSRSCGCQTLLKIKENSTTHGKTKTREYNSWRGMRERCDNPNDTHYYLYGARGITYPVEWKEFSQFLEDMGPCPENFQLDRKIVNENYSKENCRWVDKTIQSFNTRKKKNNRSGRTGVYKKPDGKWYAAISYYGKVLTFSHCDSYEDACIIREFAELFLYGFIKE